MKAIEIQKQLNRLLVYSSGQAFPELTRQREILDLLVLLNTARKKEGIPGLTLPNITLRYFIRLVNSGLLEKERTYTFYPRQQGVIHCSVPHELNRFYFDNLFLKMDTRILIFDTHLIDTICGVWVAPDYLSIVELTNTDIHFYVCSEVASYNELVTGFIELYRPGRFRNYAERVMHREVTLPGYCEVVETTRESDLERFCVG